MASVFCSDQVMASTRQVFSWPGCGRMQRRRRVGEPVPCCGSWPCHLASSGQVLVRSWPSVLALTTPRESCRVDSAHRMIQATSADLPMPWPEAMATRTASISAAPDRCGRAGRCPAAPAPRAATAPGRSPGRAACAACPRGRRTSRSPGDRSGRRRPRDGGARVEISDGRHRAPSFRLPPARAAARRRWCARARCARAIACGGGCAARRCRPARSGG